MCEREDAYFLRPKKRVDTADIRQNEEFLRTSDVPLAIKSMHATLQNRYARQ